MLLRRMDKRKDRVEISVEQLSNASTVAEISFCMFRNSRLTVSRYGLVQLGKQYQNTEKYDELIISNFQMY